MDDEFEESNGVYIIEDYYETFKDDKKILLSQLRNTIENDQVHIEITHLKIENTNKLNKLRLLLYQKFLNFLFSIICQNIRKDFKILMEKSKYLKIKNMGYKLDCNNKVNTYLFTHLS